MLNNYRDKRRESIKNASLFFKNYQFKKIILHVALCIVLLLGFSLALQGQLVSVGVMAFHDESGSGMPEELCLKIARDLQQVLVKSYSDLLTRVIGTQLDSTSIKNMSIPQLTQYGKQQGVKFLVRGGLLAISSENTGSGVKVSMDLFAEIIATDSGQTKAVRSSGVGTQGVTYPTARVPWEAIDITGSGFQYSAPGQALLNAVEQLAVQVHEAVTSPFETTTEYQAAETSPEETIEEETTGVETTESEESQNTDAEEMKTGSEAASDEELQQLIYQAEELSYNSSISEENLKVLTQALGKLKNSLEKKVTLMEQGQDTTEVEQDIATQKAELQQIITTVTEAVSTSEEGNLVEAQDYKAESGEKKNLLASISAVLGDSLNILQKIQEIKSTLKGADEEALYETEGTEETTGEGTTEEGVGEVETGEEPAEVANTDEVSGVVTEDGDPVEGVTVTDPESGVSATTDSSGYYNLGKIPAGRLSELVIAKGGKELAAGKVNLVPGHAAVADWELKPKFSKDKKPTLRVMPSMVIIAKGKKYSGRTGTIKGVVLDAQGKPMALTLVKLEGLGTVRTNSKGQYVFMKVPAGNHQLVVTKSGLNPKSQQVIVLAKKSSGSTIRFTSKDIIYKKAALPTLVMRGTTTTLFGKVTNVQKQPVKGAKVMALQSGRAVSVITGRSGMYRMKGLKPGKYRILVSKTGFKTTSQDILLKSKGSQKTDFILSGSSSYIHSLLAKRPVKRAPVVIVGTGKGQIRGFVANSKSRKGIAGATVSISGLRSFSTNGSGSFISPRIAAGTYRVTVSKTGYFSSSKTVKVQAGKTSSLTFYLPARVIRLR
jgi:hypothetical protein